MSLGDPAAPSTLEAFLLRWSVALFTLAGLLFGLVLFSVRTPTYESRTIISVVNPLGTMADEADLVASDAVLGAVTRGLQTSPEVDVEPNEVADLLTITVRADDPDDAARLATRIGEAYVQAQTTVAVRVADAAEPNPSPVAPNRLMHLVVGTALGAVVGAAVAGVQRLREFAPTRSAANGRLAPIRPARQPSTAFANQITVAAELDGNDADVAVTPRAPLGQQAMTSIDERTDVDLCDDVRIDVAKGHLDLRSAASGDTRLIDLTSGHEISAQLDLTDARAAAYPPGTGEGPPRTATPFMDQLTNEPTTAGSTRLAAAERPPSAGARSGRFVTDPADRGLTESNESASADLVTAGGAASGEPAAEAVAKEPDVTLDERGSDQSLQRVVADALEIAEVRFQAQLADRTMVHQEAISALEASHDRQVSELKSELADARKTARSATAHAQRLAGDDQHRIGDLQAQAEALEAEIGGLRSQLESERIAHLRELTNERDAADRALDEARREFREQMEANDHAGRESLSTHRSELEALLAQQRSDHQAELDRQHREHEAALGRLRQRGKDDLAKLSERHRNEMAKQKAESDENASRMLHQTKQTVSELRTAEKRMTDELDELRQTNRAQSNEIARLRSSHGDAERTQADTERSLRSELAEASSALEAERERNAALRDDVVRRTAEAHQAVDRAIEDRGQQLAELEVLVARQREHSEKRIRETTEAAEERSRAAAQREAELHARIVRLERELDGRRPQTG